MFYKVKLCLSLSYVESCERIRYACKTIQLDVLKIISTLNKLELRALDIDMELVRYLSLISLIDPGCIEHDGMNGKYGCKVRIPARLCTTCSQSTVKH